MKEIIRFLKKYKRLQTFDAIWKSLAVHSGYFKLNKEYIRISLCTGKQKRNLFMLIQLCFAASLYCPNAAERPILTQTLTCISSIVHFTLMFNYTSHTNKTIQYLEL